ncbi:hypothetical protein H0H93_011646, partial [Arthromyces matolae]
MFNNISKRAVVAYVLVAILAAATPIPPQSSQSFVPRDKDARQLVVSRSIEDLNPRIMGTTAPKLHGSVESDSKVTGISQLYIRSGREPPAGSEDHREIQHGLLDQLSAHNTGDFPDNVDNMLNFIRYLAEGPPPRAPNPHPSPRHAPSRSPSPAGSSHSSSSSGSDDGSGMNQYWEIIDQTGARMDVWKPQYEEAQMKAMKAWEDLLKVKATSTLTHEQQQALAYELHSVKSVTQRLSQSPPNTFSQSLITAARGHFRVIEQLRYTPAQAGAGTGTTSASHPSAAMNSLQEDAHRLQGQ